MSTDHNIKILKIKEIDSTNDFAKKLLKIYPPQELDGYVIYAQIQTKGRGVAGNKWISEPYKNLTFSIIHIPKKIHLDLLFYLSKAVSVAIWQFLKQHNINAKIKWPNDLIVENKKIAGILIENSIAANQVKYSIIGIGLNVNQTQFPPELNATSMKLITGKDYNLDDLLQSLTKLIFERLNDLENYKLDYIDKLYFDNLFLLNEVSQFRSNGKIFDAKVLGVDSFGRLILKNIETGKTSAFAQKQLEYIIEN